VALNFHSIKFQDTYW